jgi:hypothetical protein
MLEEVPASAKERRTQDPPLQTKVEHPQVHLVGSETTKTQDAGLKARRYELRKKGDRRVAWLVFLVDGFAAGYCAEDFGFQEILWGDFC